VEAWVVKRGLGVAAPEGEVEEGLEDVMWSLEIERLSQSQVV